MKSRKSIKVYRREKTATKKTTRKKKAELINRNISWIMISFDNDKINILLVNKCIIQ